MRLMNSKRMAIGAVLALTLASGAAAHHGWSWAEGEQTELHGTIEKVTMGGPHPTLDVATAADGVWLVEGSAKKGDPIVVLGNRSLKADEKRMKAVRITVADKRYDIYPERIQTN